MFRHGWVAGNGTLVDIRYSGHYGEDGRSGMPHFLMDVSPSVGDPFRTEVEELPLFFSFKQPGFGKTVQLRCDPKHKRARFVRSDPAINRHSDKESAKAQYQAELRTKPRTTGSS